MKTATLSLGLLLAGGAAWAAEAPEIRVVQQWDFANDVQGFEQTSRTAKTSWKDGSLHVEILGRDPYVFGPPCRIDNAETKMLAVRMKCTVGGVGELYWRPEAPGARFSAEWRTIFAVAGDGQYHDYVLAPPWQGALAQIRLDWPEGSNDSADVEWIKIIDNPNLGRIIEDKAFEFEDDSPYNWLPYGAALAGIENGILKFRVEAPAEFRPALAGMGTRQASGLGAGLGRQGLRIKTAENPVFSVRLRATQGRLAALKWQSELDPKCQASCQDFAIEPDGRFHTYNVDLSQSPVWKGVLTSFVFLVEAEPAAEVEVDYIRFGAAAQGPAQLEIAYFNSEKAVNFVGQPLRIRCAVANKGGETAQVPAPALRCAGLGDATDRPGPEAVGAGQTRELRWSLAPRRERAETIGVAVEAQSQAPLEASCALVVSRPFPDSDARPKSPSVAKTPEGLILANENVRLRFPRNGYGYGVAAFDRWNDKGQKWERVGTIPWLGELVLRESDGTVARKLLYAAKEETSEAKDGVAQLRLRVQIEEFGAAEAFLSLSVGASWVEVDWQAEAARPLSILAFRGPYLYVGEGSFGAAKDAALVPGLEWLVGEERSSSQLDATAPRSDRRVADPYKFTLPLMAIQKGDLTAGILWNALQTWDGERATPSAKFLSPDWQGNRPCHEMGLFLPSVPDWVEENRETASKPYELRPGQSLHLRQRFFAVQSDDVLAAVRLWLDGYGVPEPPRMLRRWDEALELCRGRIEEMWNPQQKQWINWKRQPLGPAGLIDLLLADLSIEKNPETKRRLSSLVQRAFEAVRETTGRDWFPMGSAGLGGASLSIALRWGRLQKTMAQGEAIVDNFLSTPAKFRSARQADGSYVFRAQEVQDQLLGPVGASEIGICAEPAARLLRYAEASGSDRALALGLETLAYMDRFKVPRASQMWEVPMHVPDPLASAQALSAYASAYRITGKQDYLEKARHWAWSGLPFIYMWGVPDRPVMKGAALGVMGCSWFTRSLWIGRPVQWVGLAYGESLLDFAPLDSQFPWRSIAEAIAVSGVNQMAAEGPAKGRYPDNWLLRSNEFSEKAMLDPTWLYTDILALRGASVAPKTTILRQGGERLHITTHCPLGELKWEGKVLRLEARGGPDDPGLVFIARAGQPSSAQLNGEALPSAADLDQVERGWAYNAQNRFLFLKLGPGAQTAEIRFNDRGPSPTQ